MVDPPLGAPGVVGFTLGFGFGFGFVLLGALGFVVELPPGAFGLVGFDPGVAFVPGVLPVGGCVVLPVGGCPVFPVGGAPGDVCPGVPELPGAPPPCAAPPPGAACATTQVAEKSNTDKSVIFLGDINEASSLRILLRSLARAENALISVIDRFSVRATMNGEYPADAVASHRRSGSRGPEESCHRATTQFCRQHRCCQQATQVLRPAKNAGLRMTIQE